MILRRSAQLTDKEGRMLKRLTHVLAGVVLTIMLWGVWTVAHNGLIASHLAVKPPEITRYGPPTFGDEEAPGCISITEDDPGIAVTAESRSALKSYSDRNFKIRPCAKMSSRRAMESLRQKGNR